MEQDKRPFIIKPFHIECPEKIEGFSLYENFRFEFCVLDEIPEILRRQSGLPQIEFDNCTFAESRALERLAEYKSLRKVRLFQSFGKKGLVSLTTLYSVLTRLKHLERLELIRCGFTEFPEVLSQLTDLKELILWGNDEIKEFPKSLGKLTSLQKLDISCCKLKEYPGAVSKLTHLKELKIWGNEEISTLPNSLGQLTLLEKLDVSSCGFRKFPEAICKLTSLETLTMIANLHVISVPRSLAKLTRLKSLNLRGCKLVDYPDIVLQMPSLEIVKVYPERKDYSFPTSPQNIRDIENLDLSRFRPDVDMSECDDPDVDLIRHELHAFPNFLTKLGKLRILCLNGNKNVKSLPPSMTQLTNLKELHLYDCGFREFPGVVCRIPNLQKVNLDENHIVILDEAFVKFWHDTSFPFQEFLQKQVIGLKDLKGLEQPPFEIFQNGSAACIDYYRSLKSSSMVGCNILSVQILGKTGAGKSSLIHTLKEGASSLVDPSDRTVVVDTVEVKDADVLLQVTDFGGHDIYELTCPLFLKSRHQATFVAVKLSDYNEDTHDELVTKWLSTAVAHMSSGRLYIAATQSDLCSDEEIRMKMDLLQKSVSDWMDTEQQYRQKVTEGSGQSHEDTSKFHHHSVRYFITSSATMDGLDELKKCLFAEARANKIIIPKHWNKMYGKLMDLDFEEQRFIHIDEAYSIFKKTVSIVRKLSNTRKDLEQCLALLHNAGMVFWYSNNENLKDVVFYNTSAMVKVLQELFRHNLSEHLSYNDAKFGKFIGTKTTYDTELVAFHQTGILSKNLLECIWESIGLDADRFDAMKHVLIQMELCYTEDIHKKVQDPEMGEKKSATLLRFPWFVHRDDFEEGVKNQWPETLPPRKLQYSLVYNFFHRIPSTIYERFCVRLQNHLLPGGHFRYDCRDKVFVQQDDVQILIERHTKQSEPSVQIQLRSPITHLLKLQHLLLALYEDMDNLCSELPRLVVDAYLLCPHCFLKRADKTTRRPIKQLVESCPGEFDFVHCDPAVVDSEQIPAAMIFLTLLSEYSKSKLVSLAYIGVRIFSKTLTLIITTSILYFLLALDI